MILKAQIKIFSERQNGQQRSRTCGRSCPEAESGSQNAERIVQRSQEGEEGLRVVRDQPDRRIRRNGSRSGEENQVWGQNLNLRLNNP